MADQEELYPIEYKGKEYSLEDCSDLFNAFYDDRNQLNPDGGVYVSEGMWVYPDGTTDDY